MAGTRRAATLMVQGCSSDAGKSILVTALCRMAHRRGIRVAPFKSQNMALNSFATPGGGEIGRAQAVQAAASGLSPDVDMNPILLKPEGDARSQVVVRGRSIGSMSAREYHRMKPELLTVVTECLERLRASHDLVVIEGAGSPAEVNLRERDIVNMRVAELADAPVLLVGDIDRGGVLASFVGTVDLLEAGDRARVKGLVVNKFRGDRTLLEPGLRFVSERTGIPFAGVVPYVPDLRVAAEDSLSVAGLVKRGRPSTAQLDVAVVRLPRISNFDDFDDLAHEPDVVVRFVERVEDAIGADLLVLPGSKSTVSDLDWLRSSGFAEAVEARARGGAPTLGVCGGCQMLGERIEDPDAVESATASTMGLGLLPIRTVFGREKRTVQVTARAIPGSMLAPADPAAALQGYEIHMGRVELTRASASAFEVMSDGGRRDGAVAPGGLVVGTMIHGILANASVRSALVACLRRRRGLPDPTRARDVRSADDELDRLASIVRGNIDLDLLSRVVGIPLHA